MKKNINKLMLIVFLFIFTNCIGDSLIANAVEIKNADSVSNGNVTTSVSEGNIEVVLPTATQIPTVKRQLIEEQQTQEPIYIDITSTTFQHGGFPQGDVEEENEIKLPNYGIINATKYKKAEKVLLSAYDSFETSCDLSEYKIPLSEIGDFVTDLLNANPRYFYVYGGVASYYEDGYVTTVLLYYNYSESKSKKMLKEYDVEMATFKKGADDSWSDMEKALYINDYIAKNCKYDITYSKYTAYDVLVNKTSICQGYALAYNAMAAEIDLESVLVSSASRNHVWNMVKINNKYYHVDATWSDPIPDTLGYVGHRYFLKSTKYYKSKIGGHYKKNDWRVGGGWKASYANSTIYDDYFWNDLDTIFIYNNGNWYNFDGKNEICRFTCNGKKFKKDETLIKIEEIWYLPNGGNHWNFKDVGVDSYKGKFYYSTDKVVYRYDLEKNSKEIFYELDEKLKKSYNIHGIYINSKGVLYCILRGNNWGDYKCHKATTIETIQAVSINAKKKTIYVGNSFTLKLTGTVIESASSSKKTVATVSAKGRVTAKKAGKTVITLKGKDGKSYKCTVTVKNPYISAKKKTLNVGKSFILKLTGTSIKSAKSSKIDVATVTSKGKVTAKKVGKTTITLKGKNGKSYKCIVTVK